MCAAIICLLSATYLVRLRGRAAFGLALCAVFASGSLLFQLRMLEEHPRNALVISQLSRFTDGKEITVTVHVTHEGTVQEKTVNEDVQKIDVETEEVLFETVSYPLVAGLRLTVFGRTENNDAPPRTFHYGERLQFPAKISLPHNFQNPGAFDYKGYLSDKGIAALASARSPEIKLLSGFAGNRFESLRARIHRSLINKIHKLWPSEQAALNDTIMLGDDTFIGKSEKTDFQRTGTYHVLVVSGLKVGILALVVSWLLRRSRINHLIASGLTVLLLIFYALLTDVGAPVWRATLMLILYFITRLLYRDRSVLNTIGIPAIALLVLDPKQLFGASFQLSFLCVLILGGIGSPILERLTQPVTRSMRNLESISYDQVLAPKLAQLRLDLRMVGDRLKPFFGRRIPLPALSMMGRGVNICLEFVLISILLQAGFVLPMAYYFHRAAIVSLPANLVVVPLTEIIMIGSGLSIAASYISATLAKVPALVTGSALSAASRTVHWMGGLRISEARVATPEVIVCVLTCCMLASAVIFARRRAIFALAGLAGVAASALWISFVPPRPRFHPGVLELTAIDVGQGDSVLLVAPQGKTLLVDAGGLPPWMHSDLDIGEDVVSPYLWARGISRLDRVAITHAHADHLGGMYAVLANFHPRELWLGVDSPAPELQRIVQEARTLGIAVVLHSAGDTLEIGGASFRILAPSAGADSQSSRPNNSSLVMKATYGGTAALLEGDAERKEEQFISQQHPQADLLKVAHHGSATSTEVEFLRAVHPRFAVISVGARNSYGHPRPEVLHRLAQSKIVTYRTDKNGAVTFYLNGKSVTADVFDHQCFDH